MTELEQLNQILIGMEWTKVTAYLNKEIDRLTEKLISQNNDETRGRIKALKYVVNLKDSLTAERDGIIASLED